MDIGVSSAAARGLCLANFDSEYAQGFMCCDVGEATFWIEPDRLKDDAMV